MSIEPKAQIQECRQRLFGMRAEMACDTVLRIATLELSVLDRRMRKCSKDELERLQGEIAVWEKIQKYVNESPDSKPQLNAT